MLAGRELKEKTIEVPRNTTGIITVLDSNTIKQIFVAYPDCLDLRERQIIKMRHINDGPRKTLQYIGAVFGVCRERVRQIERKAMRKLRCRLR